MAASSNGNLAHAKRTLELTRIISDETHKIQDYLTAHGHPDLAFDVHAPADFPVPSTEKAIHAARRAVVNATQELHDLMVGPRESVRWLAWSYNDNLSLQAVYHFKIAEAVPLDGEASFAEIASATGLDEINARRIVRHAITNRIFAEPREGFVVHTALSRTLRDDPAMIDWVGLCSSDFFPAAAHTVQAMVRWPNSQEPAQAGFPLAWNTDVPMFVEIGKDPARAKRFGGAMQSLTGGEGYEVDYLIDGYPWEELGEALVVDVGGSHGFVAVALARRFPALSFIVQDLPAAVADGPAAIPADLRDSSRITFQAHDFFDPQPVAGAAVYFFRWILHNWSDAYAVRILRALVPALRPGARVLINETVLPPPGTLDRWEERIVRTMDMTMLELLNARERAEADYRDLFRQADPRFAFRGVRTAVDGCRMSVVEAVWEP